MLLILEHCTLQTVKPKIFNIWRTTTVWLHWLLSGLVTALHLPLLIYSHWTFSSLLHPPHLDIQMHYSWILQITAAHNLCHEQKAMKQLLGLIISQKKQNTPTPKSVIKSIAFRKKPTTFFPEDFLQFSSLSLPRTKELGFTFFLLVLLSASPFVLQVLSNL